jgi:hypothetical protein
MIAAIASKAKLAARNDIPKVILRPDELERRTAYCRTSGCGAGRFWRIETQRDALRRLRCHGASRDLSRIFVRCSPDDSFGVALAESANLKICPAAAVNPDAPVVVAPGAVEKAVGVAALADQAHAAASPDWT